MERGNFRTQLLVFQVSNCKVKVRACGFNLAAIKQKICEWFRTCKASGRAGASPVPKVCPNAIFFVPLELALSEKQIPQITENTGK
jgi:hypothetical protein